MATSQPLPARHPDFIRVVLGRAVKMIETGQLHSAEVLLETLSNEAQVRDTVAYLRGIVAVGLGQKIDAQHFFKMALEINPNHAQAHAYLGNTLLDDQPAHAAAAFAAALTLNSDNADWSVGFAKSLKRLGLTELAKDNLADALAQAPAHVEGSKEMADVVAMETGGSREEAISCQSRGVDESILCDALLVEATRHQGRHDLERARRIFERLLKINPSHHLALCNFAILERQAGNFDRANQLVECARELLDRGAVSGSEFIPVRLAMAQAYIALEDSQGVRAQINAVLANVPENAGVLAACAMALQDAGLSRESLVHFERAIALNQQQSAEFFCALGSALIMIKEPGRAEIAFKHAAALAPKSKAMQRGLFETYLALGRPSEAKVQLNALLSDDSSHLLAEQLKARLANCGSNHVGAAANAAEDSIV
jgi:tetratricopeptide (TPR) repeat protein